MSKATKDKSVVHPIHYGGADNPYEVIKVMKAWLSPIELIGALKFNIFTYTARAPRKNGYEDHRKATWYQFYLDSFIKERIEAGDEHVLGAQVFWTDGFEDDIHTERDTCLDGVDRMVPVNVNTNVFPYRMTGVRLAVEDDADEIEWFDTPGAAKSYLRRFKEDESKDPAVQKEPDPATPGTVGFVGTAAQAIDTPRPPLPATSLLDNPDLPSPDDNGQADKAA